MTLATVKLNITTPTEPILPGRGFYQLEEDSLYVQLGQFSRERRFFSYLEAPDIHLDLDRDGRLIFAEIAVPRRKWKVATDLVTPTVVEAADVRWLGFRDTMTAPVLWTNRNRSILKLEFSRPNPSLFYYMAESVLIEVDSRRELSAIWITDIVDDIAGQEIASFRKSGRGQKSYYI